MEEALAAIVAQNKEIAAQNKDILQQFGSILPRLQNLESKVMRGDSKPFKNSPSSASAETHVMVEDDEENGSQDRAPKPPAFSRETFGDTPSPLLARSMHQNADNSFVLKDPAIKMTPPKVECKDQSKIRPKEFLEYFDNVDAFILSWENQPGNLKKKLRFEDAEKFALRNLLVPQQKQLSKLIKTIYDISELTFVAPENRGSVIFWQSVTTAMAKAKLCAKLSTESSLQNCSRELMRIKFVSPFGLIDPSAFDDYKSKIQDCLTSQALLGLVLPESVIKDTIIAALPDLVFQKDLYLLFGPVGVMFGHQSLEFLIATIELRISSVMSQNLHAVVNRAVSDRDSKGNKFKAINAVAVEIDGEDEHSSEGEHSVGEDCVHCELSDEQDDQMQLQAYLAVSNKEQCKRIGVGPDGKLLCSFLGGPKASCIYSHPESDLKLKGRGVTNGVRSFAPKPAHPGQAGQGKM
jgi:hypothetical protein